MPKTIGIRTALLTHVVVVRPTLILGVRELMLQSISDAQDPFVNLVPRQPSRRDPANLNEVLDDCLQKGLELPELNALGV